jgi:hypothetical protein
MAFFQFTDSKLHFPLIRFAGRPGRPFGANRPFQSRRQEAANRLFEAVRQAQRPRETSV